MRENKLPLLDKSIEQIFGGEKAEYEIPIYQRNYAWGKDEIAALVRDVYDAMTFMEKSGGKRDIYYIGTLVTYDKGEQVYEVIDGQQRLTTLYLILNALKKPLSNKLTYRAREKSARTLKWISREKEKVDEKDIGIEQGYRFAREAIEQIPIAEKDKYADFFLRNVHIIHYMVPKDIDLNHYFEVMNSRGEQLEQHEIVKSLLMQHLNQADNRKFARLWENCSQLKIYIQQQYKDKQIFGSDYSEFLPVDFDGLPEEPENHNGKCRIEDLLYAVGDLESKKITNEETSDTFQPIIDFPNFLMIVLKLTVLREQSGAVSDITLDDKELLRSFKNVMSMEEDKEAFAKRFGYNLLKARYLLDNFVVHHIDGEDRIDNNPWKLQYWQSEKQSGKSKKTNEYLKNLVNGAEDAQGRLQDRLVQLLSMFEVSFTARQRKNYLFYCLLFLFDQDKRKSLQKLEGYADFLENLAQKYFEAVYLNQCSLNSNNVPLPVSFDNAVLNPGAASGHYLDLSLQGKSEADFSTIYGMGEARTAGIPLFVFNYMDYRLWRLYADTMRGNKNSADRKTFFETLGCSPFDMNFFDRFYFSRTRRSLEHYFPQANVNPAGGTPTEDQINCFGNFAMIGAEANSAGSNWSPKTKLDAYLDRSQKISPISVASIKFMIMMQKCRDNYEAGARAAGEEWTYEDMKQHQEKMMEILF